MGSSELMRPIMRGWTPVLMVATIGYLLMSTPTPTSTHIQGNSTGCSLLEHEHFVVYSKRVVTPEGVFPAAVEIRDGRIASVKKRGGAPKRRKSQPPIFDYGSKVIMPGLVDIHVHLNEPGRSEWEGFKTGTRAAAAGGLTTLVDMPLNSYPATTTGELLELKKESSRGKLAVDVGFWGGLVPNNAHNESILEGLLQAGALGLKSFMCPSGIDDFPMTTSNHIMAALPVLAKYGRPILVHAEVPQPLEDLPYFEDGVDGVPDEARRQFSVYLSTRPPSWEEEAVRQLVQAAEDIDADGARIHIVHLADAGGSLSLIKDAKLRGLDISVETCPHYLMFAAEEVADGHTPLKCSPPVRDAANRANLWAGLMDGSIDMLASDHSPAPPDLKSVDIGDFLSAWGGILGLQFVLPATWTAGRQHGITLEQISNWWSKRPAELANLERKGSIQYGKDADLVVWDPEASFVLDGNHTIYHKHEITPYAGLSLSGTVTSTFVRGQLVFNDGEHAQISCGMKLLP